MLSFLKNCFKLNGTANATRKGKKNRQPRQMQLEQCEDRVLLTVSPLVADIPDIQPLEYAPLEFPDAFTVNMDAVNMDAANAAQAGAADNSAVQQPMAAGTSLNVGVGQTYTNIQDAVDHIRTTQGADSSAAFIVNLTAGETFNVSAEIDLSGLHDITFTSDSTTKATIVGGTGVGNIFKATSDGEGSQTSAPKCKTYNIQFENLKFTGGQTALFTEKTDGNQMYGFVIDNCDFSGQVPGADVSVNPAISLSLKSLDRPTVTNCTFDGTDIANYQAINLHGNVGGTISGNTIKNVTTNEGAIRVESSYLKDWAIDSGVVKNDYIFTISGNTISAVGKYDPAALGSSSKVSAITLYKVRENATTIVKNNTIYDCDLRGIYLYKDATDTSKNTEAKITVSNNTISNIHDITVEGGATESGTGIVVSEPNAVDPKSDEVKTENVYIDLINNVITDSTNTYDIDTTEPTLELSLTAKVTTYSELKDAIDRVNARTCNAINIAANITLAGNLPPIENACTIDGKNGETDFYVSGNHQYQIFTVDASNQTVTIQNLTIKMGFGGTDSGSAHVNANAVIAKSGTAHLKKCTITENTKDAYGALIIRPNASMTLENCSVKENSSTGTQYGAALRSVCGTLTLINTTIDGQVANKFDVSSHQSTGNSPVFILDALSTIGEYQNESGTATFTIGTDNTFTHSGGGTFGIDKGIVTLNSGSSITITAGSIAVQGEGTVNAGDATKSLKLNKVDTNTTQVTISSTGEVTGFDVNEKVTITAGSFQFKDAHEESETGYGLVDIDYGNDETIEASTQITKSSDNTITYTADETTGAAVEVSDSNAITVLSGTITASGTGSVTLKANASAIVGGVTYTNESTTDPSTLTLEDSAITAAPDAVTASVSTEAGLYNAMTAANQTGATISKINVTNSIELTSELPAINNSYSIVGTPASPETSVTISRKTDATTNFRIFTVNSGNTVLIKDLTLKDGKVTSGYGGAILANGDLEINNVTFDGNTNTANHGGAIGINSGTVTLQGNCVFTNNTGKAGGAIYVITGASLTNEKTVNGSTSYGSVIFGKTDKGNSATEAASGGGAIYAHGTVTLTATDSAPIKFEFNDSTGSGGAIYVNKATTAVTGATFTGNTAAKDGGAIYTSSNEGLVLNIANAEFTGNEAVGNGGAIDISTQQATITSSEFDSNKATGTNKCGGAIAIKGAVTLQGNCKFISNTSTYGGAVWLSKDCSLTNAKTVGAVTTYGSVAFGETGKGNSTTGKEGGALMSNGTVTLQAKDGATISFTDNTSKTLGGAVHITTLGTMEIDGATFTGNTAQSDGGAIHSKGTLNLNNATIKSSSATNGGGIYVNGGAVTISGTVNLGDSTIASLPANANAAKAAGGNTATNNGGAIYLASGSITVNSNATLNVYGNYGSGNDGGGIFTKDLFTTNTNSNLNIKYNNSKYGSGLYVNANTTTLNGNTTVQNNKAHGVDVNNAGIYMYGGNLILGGTATISDNIDNNSNSNDLCNGAQAGNSYIRYNNSTNIGIISPYNTNTAKTNQYSSDSNTFTTVSTFSITNGVVVLDGTDEINVTKGTIPVSGAGTVTLQTADTCKASVGGVVFGSNTANSVLTLNASAVTLTTEESTYDVSGSGATSFTVPANVTANSSAVLSGGTVTVNASGILNVNSGTIKAAVNSGTVTVKASGTLADHSDGTFVKSLTQTGDNAVLNLYADNNSTNVVVRSTGATVSGSYAEVTWVEGEVDGTINVYGTTGVDSIIINDMNSPDTINVYCDHGSDVIVNLDKATPPTVNVYNYLTTTDTTVQTLPFSCTNCTQSADYAFDADAWAAWKAFWGATVNKSTRAENQLIADQIFLALDGAGIKLDASGNVVTTGEAYTFTKNSFIQNASDPTTTIKYLVYDGTDQSERTINDVITEGYIVNDAGSSSTPFDGLTTLAEAITGANAAQSSVTVSFTDAVVTSGITLADPLTVNNANGQMITIDGAKEDNSAKITLTAANGAFNLTGGEVTVKGVSCVSDMVICNGNKLKVVTDDGTNGITVTYNVTTPVISNFGSWTTGEGESAVTSSEVVEITAGQFSILSTNAGGQINIGDNQLKVVQNANDDSTYNSFTVIRSAEGNAQLDNFGTLETVQILQGAVTVNGGYASGTITCGTDVVNSATINANDGGIKFSYNDSYLELTEFSGTIGDDTNSDRVTLNSGSVNVSKGQVGGEICKDSDNIVQIKTNPGDDGITVGKHIPNVDQPQIWNLSLSKFGNIDSVTIIKGSVHVKSGNINGVVDDGQGNSFKVIYNGGTIVANRGTSDYETITTFGSNGIIQVLTGTIANGTMNGIITCGTDQANQLKTKANTNSTSDNQVITVSESGNVIMKSASSNQTICIGKGTFTVSSASNNSVWFGPLPANNGNNNHYNPDHADFNITQQVKFTAASTNVTFTYDANATSTQPKVTLSSDDHIELLNSGRANGTTIRDWLEVTGSGGEVTVDTGTAATDTTAAIETTVVIEKTAAAATIDQMNAANSSDVVLNVTAGAFTMVSNWGETGSESYPKGTVKLSKGTSLTFTAKLDGVVTKYTASSEDAKLEFTGNGEVKVVTGAFDVEATKEWTLDNGASINFNGYTFTSNADGTRIFTHVAAEDDLAYVEMREGSVTVSDANASEDNPAMNLINVGGAATINTAINGTVKINANATGTTALDISCIDHAITVKNLTTAEEISTTTFGTTEGLIGSSAALEVYGSAAGDLINMHGLGLQSKVFCGAGDDVVIGAYEFDLGEGDNTVVVDLVTDAGTKTGLELRQAVVQTQAQTEGTNTIEFGSSISTVKLTSSTTNIAINTGSFTISGKKSWNVSDGSSADRGGKVTIDANNAGTSSGRHFNISSSGTISMDNLILTNATLFNGNYGGSIYSHGDNGVLNLTDVDFTKNRSASGPGGSIWTSSTLNLNNVTITGANNSSKAEATNGGGICQVDGTVTSTGYLTITNCRATDCGGAIYNEAGELSLGGAVSLTGNTASTGGGIRHNSSDTLTLGSNVTIKDNKASGNGANLYVASGKTVTIDGATISDVGTGSTATEGVYVAGVLNINSGTTKQSVVNLVAGTGTININGTADNDRFDATATGDPSITTVTLTAGDGTKGSQTTFVTDFSDVSTLKVNTLGGGDAIFSTATLLNGHIYNTAGVDFWADSTMLTETQLAAFQAFWTKTVGNSGDSDAVAKEFLLAMQTKGVSDGTYTFDKDSFVNPGFASVHATNAQSKQTVSLTDIKVTTNENANISVDLDGNITFDEAMAYAQESTETELVTVGFNSDVSGNVKLNNGYTILGTNYTYTFATANGNAFNLNGTLTGTTVVTFDLSGFTTTATVFKATQASTLENFNFATTPANVTGLEILGGQGAKVSNFAVTGENNGTAIKVLNDNDTATTETTTLDKITVSQNTSANTVLEVNDSVTMTGANAFTNTAANAVAVNVKAGSLTIGVDGTDPVEGSLTITNSAAATGILVSGNDTTVSGKVASGASNLKIQGSGDYQIGTGISVTGDNNAISGVQVLGSQVGVSFASGADGNSLSGSIIGAGTTGTTPDGANSATFQNQAGVIVNGTGNFIYSNNVYNNWLFDVYTQWDNYIGVKATGEADSDYTNVNGSLSDLIVDATGITMGATFTSKAVDSATPETGKTVYTVECGDYDYKWTTGISTFTLYCGAGNDIVNLSAINTPSIIYGGDGHDVLIGGSGNDYIDGEGGNDLTIGEQYLTNGIADGTVPTDSWMRNWGGNATLQNALKMIADETITSANFGKTGADTLISDETKGNDFTFNPTTGTNIDSFKLDTHNDFVFAGEWWNSILVTTADDKLDTSNANGKISLREAIKLTESGYDTIKFAVESVNVDTSAIVVDKAYGVTIDGTNVYDKWTGKVEIENTKVTITAKNNADDTDTPQVMKTSNGGALGHTLTNLIITGANTSENGAGINVSGLLNLNNVQVTGNTTSTNGGGIYINDGSTVKTTGTTDINGNTAAHGGGLYINNGSLIGSADTGASLTIQNNTGTTTGGGISTNNVINTVAITNADIHNNTGGTGGGLCVRFGTDLTLTDVNITSNSATEKAGGMFIGATTDKKASVSTVGTVDISENKAPYAGGVQMQVGTSLTKVDEAGSLLIHNNSATATDTTNRGGGVYIENATSITGVDIYANSATNGGGLYVANGTATLTDVEIGKSGTGNANTATDGGGVYVTNGATLTLNNSDIQYNTANQGAGVYMASGKISGSTTLSYIQYNDTNATNDQGGGVYVAGKATIEGNDFLTIQNNTAKEGAGVYNAGANTTISKVTMTGNKATSGGGVYTKANLTLTDSSIGEAGDIDYSSANTATSGGGAFVTGGATLTLANSDVQYNTAANGGGVYLNNGKLEGTVADDGKTLESNITNNKTTAFITTDNQGGNVYAEAGTNAAPNVISNITISGNGSTAQAGKGAGLSVKAGAYVTLDNKVVFDKNVISGSDGGGIFNSGNILVTTSTNLIMSGNKANWGGALYNNNSGIFNNDGTAFTADIYDNVAGTQGGAIFTYGYSTITKFVGTGDGTTASPYSIKFHYNVANSYGGAVTLEQNSSALFKNVEFYENASQTDGGAVYAKNGILELNNVSIHDNGDYNTYKTDNGGGLYVTGGTTYLQGTVSVTDNKATNGAGVYVADGTLTNVKSGSTNGTVLIDRNTATTNGGGMYVAAGTVTLTGTTDNPVTISNNEALVGGGIYNASTELNLDGVTITGNKAVAADGTTYGETNLGGGLYTTASITLTDSTIGGTAFGTDSNTAYSGGGAYVTNGATLTLDNSDIQYNTALDGGGVYLNNGSLAGTLDGTTLESSIANNRAYNEVTTTYQNGGNVYSTGGTATSPNTIQNIAISGDGKTKQAANGAGLYVADGTLTNVKNNVSGTVLIDGNTSVLNGGGLYVVSGTNVTLTGTTDNPVTISDNVANAVGGGIYNASSKLALDGVSITGNKAETRTGAGTTEDPYVYTYEATNLGGGLYNTAEITGDSLQNLTFTENAAYAGGGVYTTKDLKLTNSTIGKVSDDTNAYKFANTATSGGGAYVTDNATLTLDNSVIQYNTALDGGGVYLNGGNLNGLDQTKSSIANNRAYNEVTTTYQNGGNVYSTGTNTIQNIAITGDGTTTQAANGGGLYVADGTTTLVNSTIGKVSEESAQPYKYANVADNGGGAYVTGGATLTLDNSDIQYNYSKENGGGVYLNNGTLAGTLDGTTLESSIANNRAYAVISYGFGGNVFATLTTDGANTIKDIAITGDGTTMQAYQGGGLYTDKSITVTNVSFTKNAAFDGGGVFATGTGAIVTLTSSTIGKKSVDESNAYEFANVANVDGGGAFVTNGATLTLANSNILYNQVTNDDGGGVFVYGGTLNTSGVSNISGNKVRDGRYGGGIYVENNTVDGYNGAVNTTGVTTISNNTAGTTDGMGGGVHLNGGTFTTSGTTSISENTAGNGGGGVCVYNGTFNTSGTTSINNNTNNNYGGGGVYLNGGTVNTSGETNINNNEAIGVSIDGTGNSDGGGVYIINGSFNMNGTTNIRGNEASQLGGGVFVGSKGTFTNVTTTEGGAPAYGTVLIDGNTAASSGGGILVAGSSSGNGTVKLVDPDTTTNDVTVTISNNVANVYGGGVHNNSTNLNLDGVSITGNKAVAADGTTYGETNRGGGLLNLADLSGNKLANLTITGNSAHVAGGVYTSGAITFNGANSISNNVAKAVTGETLSGSTDGDGGGLYIGQTTVKTGADSTLTISGNIADCGAGVYLTGSTASPAKLIGKFVDGADPNPDTYSISITGNRATAFGGGVQVGSGSQSAVLENVNISNNTVTGIIGADSDTSSVGNGGGIGQFSGLLEIQGNVLVNGNEASGANGLGGGISVGGTGFTSVSDDSVTLTVSGSLTVSSNEANDGAGVFVANKATFTNVKEGAVVGKVTIGAANRADGNVATNNGGGIYNAAGGTVTLTGSTDKAVLIANNQANAAGGGIYNASAKLNLDGITIDSNYADVNDANPGVFIATNVNKGGGVYNNAEITGTVKNLTLSNNAAFIGGGIYNDTDGKMTLSGTNAIFHNIARKSYNANSRISGLDDGNNGGGIYNNGTFVNAEGANTTIGKANGENFADFGGGIYNNGTFTNAQDAIMTISTNSAFNGGGIYNDGTFNPTGSTIFDANKANNKGAGVYQNGETIAFDSNDKIVNNMYGTYGVDGAGMYIAAEKTVSVDGTTIHKNAAGDGSGGGIYNDGTLTVAGTTTIGDATTQSNTAANGGGIYNNGEISGYANGKTLTVSNNAATNGGGIYQTSETSLNLNSSLFVTNNKTPRANSQGAGVYIDSESVANLANLAIGTTETLYGNKALGANAQGGAFYVAENGTLNVTGASVIGTATDAKANQATNGGGIYLDGELTTNGNVLTFQKNNVGLTTANNGGGLYISPTGTYQAAGGYNFVIDSATELVFKNNGDTTGTRGGAIYNAGSMYFNSTDPYLFGATAATTDGKTTITQNVDLTNFAAEGAAIYNVGTLGNAYLKTGYADDGTYYAGSAETTDSDALKRSNKTFSLFITNQQGGSAFANGATGNATLSNAKIYGNASGGVCVENGTVTLNDGTEIGVDKVNGTIDTTYNTYADGTFTPNTGYGARVVAGELNVVPAESVVRYHNEFKTEDHSATGERYKDYVVKDSVKISGNTGTGVVVEGGAANINDARIENNGAGMTISGGTTAVANSLIADNTGTGVDVTGDATVEATFINSTIAGNAAGAQLTNAGAVVTLQNSIAPSAKGVTNNNVGATSGILSVDNYDFVTDVLRNKYTLGAWSEALDSGINAQAVYSDGATAIDKDLAGHDRILYNTVDLGCFEQPIFWVRAYDIGGKRVGWLDDVKRGTAGVTDIDLGGKIQFDATANGATYVWSTGATGTKGAEYFGKAEENQKPKIQYQPSSLVVDKSCIIDGRYVDDAGNQYWMDITLDAEGLSGLFLKGDSTSKTGTAKDELAIYGLTMVNGDATKNGMVQNGGAVSNPSDAIVRLYSCSFIGNYGNTGGAIYNGGYNLKGSGTIEISTPQIAGQVTTASRTGNVTNVTTETAGQYKNAVFANNTALHGGAIYSLYGSANGVENLTINGVSLATGNTKTPGTTGVQYYTTDCSTGYETWDDAAGEGVPATARLQYSVQFVHNSSKYEGGAIHSASNTEIDGASFLFNHSSQQAISGVSGGAVYTSGSAVTLNNADFIANHSGGYGGALGIYGSAVTSDGNLVFAGNSVGHLYNGGAVYAASGSLTINNTAQVEAGRFLFATADVTDTIENNLKSYSLKLGTGAGDQLATVDQPETGDGYSSNFLCNEASEGGALYVAGAAATINTGYFAQNKAGNGGAVFFKDVASGSVSFADSILEYNFASGLGGAMYFDTYSDLNIGGTLQNNWAGGNGGGYWTNGFKSVGTTATNNFVANTRHGYQIWHNSNVDTKAPNANSFLPVGPAYKDKGDENATAINAQLAYARLTALTGLNGVDNAAELEAALKTPIEHTIDEEVVATTSPAAPAVLDQIFAEWGEEE